MGRLKGVPQTGRVAVERRERAVRRTAHKEAIVKGTIALDVPEPMVPELFQDIQTVYWNCLKAVPDPRSPGQIVYPLYQILHRILAEFLTGARTVGVLFPRQHRVVACARPGRAWRLCGLPTQPAVYRLLRRVDWAAAQVALAPLWPRLGYAPAAVMMRAPRDPKDILEEFRQALAATAAQKAAELKAAQRAAEKAQGMSAAKACRQGRRVPSVQRSAAPAPAAKGNPSRRTVAETPVGSTPAVPLRPPAPRTNAAPTMSLPTYAPSAVATGAIALVPKPNGVGPAATGSQGRAVATGFPSQLPCDRRPALAGPAPRPQRQDLLLDGKVVRASYHTGCQERFVHVTAVTASADGARQRFIVGARPTVLDRNGEWGAALSILDTVLPMPVPRSVLVSGDAGVCVEEHAAWLCVRQAFYLFRIKANAGHLFDRVIAWAETARARRPDGDFFEAARVSGAAIHSRRLWRLPGLRFASFPGMSEAFVIEKKSAEASAVPELQYYITSYPQAAWSEIEILERILLHWDTETGVFGVKDGTFDEDSVRYKYLEGATAHVVLLNTVMNCLWAPVFTAWWLPNAPLSHRIQFFRDQPNYCPFQPP